MGPADEGFDELEVGDVDKFANVVFSGGIEGGMLLVGIDIGEGVRVWGAYGVTRGEYGALGDGAVNDDVQSSKDIGKVPHTSYSSTRACVPRRLCVQIIRSILSKRCAPSVVPSAAAAIATLIWRWKSKHGCSCSGCKSASTHPSHTRFTTGLGVDDLRHNRRPRHWGRRVRCWRGTLKTRIRRLHHRGRATVVGT